MNFAEQLRHEFGEEIYQKASSMYHILHAVKKKIQ